MSADEQHEDHPPASESPFGSEDESGDSALLDADDETLREFIGETYANMDLKTIELELKALETENSEIELETKILSGWKDEHEEDFATVFGSTDQAVILRKLQPTRDAEGRKSTSTNRRKTQRTLKKQSTAVGTIPTNNTETQQSASIVLTLAQKSSMVNFYDSQIRRELESEQTAMMDVEADYVAAIDEATLTNMQLRKRFEQIKSAFMPRRVESLTGSSRPTHQYFENRMTETLSWLDNEVQHCRVNADMTSARVAKVKTQIQRVAIEDTTKELGILDFERLKITVDKGEASLNMINRKFFLIKSNEQRVSRAHGHAIEVLRIAENEFATLRKEIHTREKMLSRLTKDRQMIKDAIADEKEKNATYSKKFKRFEAPPVLDYIREKKTIQEREKKRQALDRQLQVAKMQLKQVKLVWETLQPAVARTNIV